MRYQISDTLCNFLQLLIKFFHISIRIFHLTAKIFKPRQSILILLLDFDIIDDYPCPTKQHNNKFIILWRFHVELLNK